MIEYRRAERQTEREREREREDIYIERGRERGRERENGAIDLIEAWFEGSRGRLLARQPARLSILRGNLHSRHGVRASSNPHQAAQSARGYVSRMATSFCRKHQETVARFHYARDHFSSHYLLLLLLLLRPGRFFWFSWFSSSSSSYVELNAS